MRNWLRMMCRQQEERYERGNEHYPAIYWNFPGDAVIIGVHPGKSGNEIGRQIMPGTSFVDIGGFMQKICSGKKSNNGIKNIGLRLACMGVLTFAFWYGLISLTIWVIQKLF